MITKLQTVIKPELVPVERLETKQNKLELWTVPISILMTRPKTNVSASKID